MGFVAESLWDSRRELRQRPPPFPAPPHPRPSASIRGSPSATPKALCPPSIARPRSEWGHDPFGVPGRGTIGPSTINGTVAFCASKPWETHESGMSGTCHAQLFLTWCIGATPSESQTKGLDALICKTIASEWLDPEVVKAVLSHKERIKSGARESSRLPLRSASLKLFNRTFATGWPF